MMSVWELQFCYSYNAQVYKNILIKTSVQGVMWYMVRYQNGYKLDWDSKNIGRGGIISNIVSQVLRWLRKMEELEDSVKGTLMYGPKFKRGDIIEWWMQHTFIYHIGNLAGAYIKSQPYRILELGIIYLQGCIRPALDQTWKHIKYAAFWRILLLHL